MLTLPPDALDELDVGLPTANPIANVWFDAAQTLGLGSSILSAEHGAGIISDDHRELLIYGRWIGINDISASTLCGLKDFASRRLSEAAIPVPEFRVAAMPPDVTREVGAKILMEAAHDLYPVCIKPTWGSHGQRVIPDIRNEEELLREIYHDVTLVMSDMLVERFISGRHYRVIVAWGEVIGCVERTRPTVFGDGNRTLEALVEEQNTIRSLYTLEPALIGRRQKECIARSHDLSPGDIVPDGLEVLLDDRCNLKVGGDIHHVDVSRISAPLSALCLNAAAAFGLEFAGLDLIGGEVEDADGWVVNEVNSQPAAHVPVTTMKREHRLLWPRRLLERYFAR